jgi:hypothetical protein
MATPGSHQSGKWEDGGTRALANDKELRNLHKKPHK